MTIPEKNDIHLSVIGLGYVGLPLAVAFGRKIKTIGYDISQQRINDITNGIDATNELTREELKAAKHLTLSHNIKDLAECNVYIVTVPTPIDSSKQPDLTPLKSASQQLSRILSRGDIVVYESTVYPGATEEVCVPILEQGSGLTVNQDFHYGYSPERINPGDREHTLDKIAKVVAGSSQQITEFLYALYSMIIEAEVHATSSVRVAEAAKVIENTQRDLNIALINELTMIFRKLGLDTQEVLQAAGTKWNFLPFQPGLVGGHCIGVDPYYLTHKSESIGYHPEIILAGRRINDGMSGYIAAEIVKLMTLKGITVGKSNILVMGLTFKENCPDTRNSLVFRLLDELESYGIKVDVFDPWVNAEEIAELYMIRPIEEPKGPYDAMVIAVSHQQFIDMGAEKIRKYGKQQSVLFDIKSIFPKNDVDDRL